MPGTSLDRWSRGAPTVDFVAGSASATCADISKDGRLIVSGHGLRRPYAQAAASAAVEVWSVADKATVERLPLPAYKTVRKIRAFEDGKRAALVAHGFRGETDLLVLDLETKQQVAFMGGGSVRALNVSGDGGTIVTGDEDGKVTVWKWREGHSVRVIDTNTHHPVPGSAAGLPDDELENPEHGQRMAVAARRMGLPSRLAGNELEDSAPPVVQLAVSPDGTRVASVSGRLCHIRVWDAPSGSELCKLEGHFDSINALEFSRDGSLLFSGGRDTSVRVWNAATGAQRRVIEAHTLSVFALAHSPDATLIASTGNENKLCLWDAQSGKKIYSSRYKEHAFANDHSIRFSADGSRVIAVSSLRQILIWNCEERAEGAFVRRAVPAVARWTRGRVNHCSIPSAVRRGADRDEAHSILSIDISPNGQFLVEGQDCGGSINVQDVAETLYHRKISEFHTQSLPLLGAHDGDAVNAVRYFPEGHRVVSGGSDRHVRVWHTVLTTREQLAALKCDGVVWAVDVSQDGETVVAGDETGSVVVWRSLDRWIWSTVATEVFDERSEHVQVLRGHSSRVNAVAISRNGKLAASGSDDMTVRVWSIDRESGLASGRELFCLTGHSGAVRGLVWCPDQVTRGGAGSTLLSAGDDGAIHVWAAASGELLRTLPRGNLRDGSGINALAISKDGTLLAAATDDGTVILYEPSGLHVRELNGHSGRVWAVAFSEDSSRIVACSEDKTSIVWSTGPLPLQRPPPAFLARLAALRGQRASEAEAGGTKQTTPRAAAPGDGEGGAGTSEDDAEVLELRARAERTEEARAEAEARAATAERRAGDLEAALAAVQRQLAAALRLDDAHLDGLSVEQLDHLSDRLPDVMRRTANLRVQAAKRERDAASAELEAERRARAAVHESLMCAVCQERPVNVTLHCGHTWCRQCVESLPVQANARKCPECRQPFATWITTYLRVPAP
eukprot:tig00001027_g6384.t1